MRDKDFRDGMERLAATFGRDLSPTLLRVYGDQFGDWSAEAWAHVVNRACADLKFWPKPVELAEMAAVSRGDAVERAWGVVEQALRSVSRYRSIDFGPVVNAAIRHIGGWEKLCNTPTAELHFRQQDFRKALDMYSRSTQIAPDRGAYLAGLEELNCILKGHPVPEMLGRGPRAVPLRADLTAEILGARRPAHGGGALRLAGGEAA